jgi:TPR repeat protein
MYVDARGQVAAAASTTDEIRMMAAQGNAQLQHQLGLMYLNGDGLAKDLTAAAQWLQRAAEQGVAPAQSVLGLMYAAGAGVPKDEIEALAWFMVAAQAGEPEAMKNRELAAGEVGTQGVLKAQLRSQAIAAAIESQRKTR